MKEIVTRDFGLCPKCQSRLLYLTSVYQLGMPSPGGRTLERIIGEDKDITGVCPKCNNKVRLTSSLYGITTPEYYKLVEDQERIKKDKGINIIGYVDERG